MRTSLSVLCLVGALAAASVLAYMQSADDISVMVQNGSREPLSDVEADFLANKMNVKNIDVGGRATFNGSSDKDGVLKLTFRQRGRVYQHELGYITPGLRRTCNVTVGASRVSSSCCYGRKCKVKHAQAS